MRRWAPALCASLALHSLLLLAPGASETRREGPGEFRLVLRAVKAESPKPAVSAPEPERPAPKPPEKRPEPASKAAPKSQPKPKPQPRPKELPAPQAKPPAAAVDPPEDGRNDGIGAPAQVAKSPDAGRPAGATGSTEAKAGPVDVKTLRILSQPPPEYPLFSRRRKEEGVVRLLLTIRSGRVADASVAVGSGSSRLDEAALKAVKQWRFDHPGEVRATASIVFRLN
ncbi:MAG: TonB family protein [Synergistaceae bacterium]|nr:TonB family protein [Synergistota bacterium]NLM72364.1 TonB family protein [Synergistaceae bacterium]